MLACVCHPTRAHNLPVSLEPVHRPRARHNPPPPHPPVYTSTPHHSNHHNAYSTSAYNSYVPSSSSSTSSPSSSSSSPSSSSSSCSSSSSTCDDSNHASSTPSENGKSSVPPIENGVPPPSATENGSRVRSTVKKRRTKSLNDKSRSRTINNNNDRTSVDRNNSFSVGEKRDYRLKSPGDVVLKDHRRVIERTSSSPSSSPMMKHKSSSTLERRKPLDGTNRYANAFKERAATLDHEDKREKKCNKGGCPDQEPLLLPAKVITKLPDGCELTVGELRDMANRQQQQIETQQQLLVAREQRLKYLKQQESRAAAVAAEADRLRRLRERVEAQEAKLRRLRALRGQVEATRLNTASLTTDLDAMRHLFSEKEKELVVAVSKVEELTRQLEELRHGRSPLSPNNQHHNELDKLRRELLYRNSVNREASARVDAQRETLAARRDEIARIDKRIAELQQRLHRKRILNHQLASQITAATQAKQAQLKAVQQKAMRDGVHTENSADDLDTPDQLKVTQGEDLGEFGPNKNDPKYQTLPYNTKFSVTFKTKNGQGGDSDSAPTTPTGIAPPIPPAEPSTSTSNIASTTVPVNNAVVTRTVHSIPMHPPSRGHAHAPGAVSQPQPLVTSQQHSGPLKPPPNPAMTPRVYGPAAQQFNQRAQPLGSTTSGSHLDSRPLLPPTSLSVCFNQKLNPGIASHPQSRNLLPMHQSQEGEGSEETASGTENGRVKPALPPKPAVPSKPLPPPRQKGDPLAASNESLNSAQSANRIGNQGRSQHAFRYASQNVIMSTYTQQPGTDSQSADGNEESAINRMANNSKNETETGDKVHVSINRRIEMPPDFMFPEDETPPSDLLGQKVDEIEHGAPDNLGHHLENGSDTVDNFNIQPMLPVMELEKLRIDQSKDENRSNADENNIVHISKDDCRKPDGADTSTVPIEERRPENEGDRSGHSTMSTSDIINNINNNINNNNINNNSNTSGVVVRRLKKGNLKTKNSSRVPRRVSFDPLALLLDASLEGELELVRRTAMEVPNPSAANDEGITALHNAICAGHLDIVTFLVTFGCDVNAQDSDGWTPLHCAASCNNVAMVRFLVEHGACILATTLSDHETAAEKCEQEEEGYDGCSQYLYSVQEKLGIMNGGVVYGVYDYEGQATDELTFRCGEPVTILRRGDEYEREWWWGQLHDIQGYVPRNLLGLYPRVKNPLRES